MGASESRPERVEAASKAGGPDVTIPRASAGSHFPRPDLWDVYPPPEVNFRPTKFGLTLEEYRAEWRRCRDAGWSRWELERRFPAPHEGVAA